MRSPIGRVYLMLLFALVGPLSVVSVALRKSYDRATERQFEGLLHGHATLVRHAMAESGAPPEAVAAELSEAMSVPVRLLPAAELDLSASQVRRLAEGAPVVTTTWMGVTGYLPAGGFVAEVGPFERVLPLGGERGVLAALLIVGSCGLAIYLVIRPLDRQLTNLSAAASRFGQGDLAARAVPMGRDPAGELAVAFNAMADRIGRLIDNQRALLHVVSHELRTPLARLRFGVALLEGGADAAERGRRVEALERDVSELDVLVGELLQFLRLEGGPELDRAEVDLRALLAEVIQAVLPLKPEVDLGLDCEEPVLVRGDPKLLRRAAQNLACNAMLHAAQSVLLSVGSAAGEVRIIVDDDGPGVPELERERIFEPFVRLSRDREKRGSGLGLAIVRRIVEAHQGRVWVESGPLGGARFVISLPWG